MKRRDFLKTGIVACAAGLIPLSACSSEAPQTAIGEDAKDGKERHWALAIDVIKLNRLGVMNGIIKACHKAHNVPNTGNATTEVKWIFPESFEHAFPDTSNSYLPEGISAQEFPVLCNHCDEPPCARVCPTEATFKRADGVVAMDYHRCIGCRFCMAACPYGARSLNFDDPRLHLDEVDPDYPTRTKGIVEKCTLCSERIVKGEAPLCVEASKGAILFGDLNEPDSEIRRALSERVSLRRRTELGTGPNVYYLVEGGEHYAG